ncbi:allophanate hydrolase, subunit 1 [Candidatus Vecturithrix granuli]|uniref:Allophanate hydrolase, subunit 1 n=1 Tax=Vecturithrix granuli TaxID=1499967 RepID=A0A081BVC3_VECG1|nr:allophanate hydrolase, subunit 1 [Candidatus Vecturithrix granuli]
MYAQFRYLPAGDSALVVELGNEIDPVINQTIRGLVLTLQQQTIPGIREYVPTYRSLMILYDPAVLWFDDLIEQVKKVESRLEAVSLPEPKILEVPVAYGGEFGPDLDFVAEHTHLSVEKVIALHTGRDYLVYMLGFTPGFCYLGGLSEQLETPRLATPRTKIPAGSVGIAGKQTGVYPIDSPGGWQLIGRTPLCLFDPQRDPAVLITAGDYVRFVQIDEPTYHQLAEQVQRGELTIQTVSSHLITG